MLPTWFDSHPPGKTSVSVVNFRSRFYRDLIEDLRTAGVTVDSVAEGKTVGPWQVLLPDAGAKPRTADHGVMVLYGEWYGVRVLLLSEIGRAHV